MTRFRCAALLCTIMLAACSSAAPPADADAPVAEKLPLKKRVVYVKDGDVLSRKVTKHVAVFGNWAAECSWGRGSSGDVSFCDVYPWNGKLPERATVIIPYGDRATVQYYQAKPAKVVINTARRAADTTLRYVCGAVEWSGPEDSSRLKFFYDDQAQRFISQMTSSDCKIIFTPDGEKESKEILRIAHGFREANEYGAYFSRYPKPVEPQS